MLDLHFHSTDRDVLKALLFKISILVFTSFYDIRNFQMLGKLWHLLGPEGGRHGAADGLSRLRFWAAVAIVFVSAGSALAVLKAAVYDERSSHEDALYRQQLVIWQQTNRLREEEVAQDVALFGSYEQRALHARDLQREALALTANPRLANSLRSRAEREQAAAAALLAEFQVEPPVTGSRHAPAYDPSAAYRIAVSSPQALAEDLSPGDHRLAARNARHDGVSMVGVAALFLAALVLLTVAQVFAGAMAPKVSEKEETLKAPDEGETAKALEEEGSMKVPKAVLRSAYTLFAAGLFFALVALSMGLQVVT